MVSNWKKKQPIKVKRKQDGVGRIKILVGKDQEKHFRYWGNNVNSLKAKMSSLKANIEHFQHFT
jgi:hypothetical protein